MKSSKIIVAAITVLVAICGLQNDTGAASNRLKELVTVEGFRTNTLTGFGLVVGLAGTGDNAQSLVVKRSLSNMMRRLGVTINPADINAKNVAAVIVTAKLPPFARSGMGLDVIVSSMGEAKSLQGGTLIATPLKGSDLRTYALAQGPLSLGGFAVEGGTGSSTRKNHSTVARIPGGAVLEQNAPTNLPKNRVTLLLKDADFTTASRIASAIDKTFNAKIARVRDPGAVNVMITPQWRKHAVHFISLLESIEAVPDAPARVIIDERTGTVVVGKDVRLGQTAIAHGALTININEGQVASQPGGIASKGSTVVTKQTDIKVDEADGDLKVINRAATVSDVAAALNSLGAKPRDLVSIFQALKAAGALRAEILVI